MTEFTPYSLNLGGKLLEMRKPLVMGILNATPDSFYAGCRCTDEEAMLCRISQICSEGADIIDIGGYSSRPGAEDVPEAEELRRVLSAFELVRKVAPEMPVSIDTFRSGVVSACHDRFGSFIVNDISGGSLDGDMYDTVASLRLPYILMHMRGTPQSMQQLTDYGTEDVLCAVITDLAKKIAALTALGVADIIVDPGFGFGKTLEQNYYLLAHLEEFHALGMPLLVGISRKSMIYKAVGTDATGALAGTTTLNAIACEKGAHLLRVHDVADARQCVDVFQFLRNNY